MAIRPAFANGSPNVATYGVIYTSEALGNVSGGIRQGALYGGKLRRAVSANLRS